MTLDDKVQIPRLHVFRRVEQLGSVTAAHRGSGILALALLPAARNLPTTLRHLASRFSEHLLAVSPRWAG